MLMLVNPFLNEDFPSVSIGLSFDSLVLYRRCSRGDDQEWSESPGMMQSLVLKETKNGNRLEVCLDQRTTSRGSGACTPSPWK